MKHYIIVVLPRLKLVWLVVFFIGLMLIFVSLYAGPKFVADQYLIYAGGAVIGFASSAYFSCKEQFLLRGSGGTVYLVQNRLFLPHVYQLVGRETLNAFGGIWYEVYHVSERTVRHLHGRRKGQLNLNSADLYKVKGGNTIFAVLSGIRYGVPDFETRKRIWGSKPETEAEIDELDKWNPGRDLVSIHYWPERDRRHE